MNQLSFCEILGDKDSYLASYKQKMTVVITTTVILLHKAIMRKFPLLFLYYGL